MIGARRNQEKLRTYTYDAFGNRVEKIAFEKESEMRTYYKYNARNQLLYEKTGESERSYQYDNRGNMCAVRDSDSLSQVYEFDATNRMNSVESMMYGMNKKVVYGYNAMGQRISQDIYQSEKEESLMPVQQMRYAVDLTRTYNNLLTCEEQINQKTQKFFWNGNVAVLQEKGKNNYYLQDDLGSPVRVMDAEGKSLVAYAYDEFGLRKGETEEENSFSQPFGFTGYQTDDVSNLCYAQARRYDAINGRFVSEDPIRYGDNWYTYVSNNPQNRIDPLGLMSDEPETERSSDGHFASDWMDYLGMLNQYCNPLYLRWAKETREGKWDDFFAAVDFEKGSDGNYHVNTNKYTQYTDAYRPFLEEISPGLASYLAFGCWQQLGGYNTFYDMVFDLFCSMDADKHSFEVTDAQGNTETYTIWMWKGEYLNLGAGGECGLYTGSHWWKAAAVDDAVPMTLYIDYGDGTRSQWADWTWWITSFNPYKQDVEVNDITITGTIDFSYVSDEVWEAFEEKYNKNGSPFSFYDDSRIVTYTW